MQENFMAFNAEATEVRTMEHNGLTLVWSEPDGRFMLPQPEGAKSKILFDDTARTFIQVTITNPAFVYRDRTATAPDGTTMQERLLIARDKSGNEIEIPDADFQKLILNGKILAFKQRFVEMALGWIPMLYLGVITCMAAFFWNLASAAGLLAKAFATGSAAAITQVGYLFACGAGLLIALLFIWYVVPKLFKVRQIPEVYYTDPNEQPTNNTTNIVVNNIHGSGNTAQDYINGRRL